MDKLNYSWDEIRYPSKKKKKKKKKRLENIKEN